MKYYRESRLWYLAWFSLILVGLISKQYIFSSIICSGLFLIVILQNESKEEYPNQLNSKEVKI